MHIAIAVLRKQPLTPAIPMKPLYWTRIIVPPSGQPASPANRCVDFHCAKLHLVAGSIKHLTSTYSTTQLAFKQYLPHILPALPDILTNFFMLLYHLSKQILVHYFLICQYHHLLVFSICEHFFTSFSTV